MTARTRRNPPRRSEPPGRESNALAAWQVAAERQLSLDVPRVMGILNVTPDSFSDGGAYASADAAVEAALRMINEGAAIIDIGGESTRPGAQSVSEDEQMRRVLPVIERLRARGIVSGAGERVLISIDTTRAAVALAALEAGAGIINDVSAGTDDAGMLPLAASRACGLILMHRWKKPPEDIYSTEYAREPDYGGDVYGYVREFLRQRALEAVKAGVRREAIVVDPGLGFGKSVEQNRELMRRLGALQRDLDRPALSAASRKSFLSRWIEQATGEKADPNPASRERMAASVGVTLSHWQQGVRLFRVHDVWHHAQALQVVTEMARPVQ